MTRVDGGLAITIVGAVEEVVILGEGVSCLTLAGLVGGTAGPDCVTSAHSSYEVTVGRDIGPVEVRLLYQSYTPVKP